MPLLLCLRGPQPSRNCPVPYSPGAVKTAPYKAPVFRKSVGRGLDPSAAFPPVRSLRTATGRTCAAPAGQYQKRYLLTKSKAKVSIF